MPAFVHHYEVPASPAAVFAYMVDLANWPGFPGYGPVPAITAASAPGGVLTEGARVRVENSDGSVHHEVVTHLEPGARYAVRMELGLPGSLLVAAILEDVRLSPSPSGTRMSRSFEMVPRWRLAWPLVAVVCHVFLKRAVRRHDAIVTQALSPR